MIILEGTDKAGKTTFLSNLIKFYPIDRQKDLKIIHFGLLPENWDYQKDYFSYIKPNIILDRFIDSERAYGPVYRNSVNPLLNRDKLNAVYKRCAEIGTLTLYCNPSIEEVMKRLDAQGDMMIKKREQLEVLRNLFDQIYNKYYPLDLEILNTTQPMKDDIYKKIVVNSTMLERQAKQISDLNYRGYVSLLCKYVIYINDYSQYSTIEHIIQDSTNIPITHFAIISSRNMENKPVNIQSLLYLLPVIKKVIVLGDKSIKDYNEAGNKTACNNCSGFYEFMKIIKDLNVE